MAKPGLIENVGASPPMADEAAFTAVYEALRSCAQRLMRSERANTLQPTALVHEAWIKVLAARPNLADQRDDLLAYAASAMRTILVDYLRRRRRRFQIVVSDFDETLDSAVIESFADLAIDVLSLDDALRELATFDPTMARVVELHFFAGLDQQSVSRLLGIPIRTLERHWQATRAWLFRKLS